MPRSAAGFVEQRGRNVRAESGLNRSILDQGWAEFRGNWSIKCYGRAACFSPCRHRTPLEPVRVVGVSPGNRLSQAVFACVECGFQENADLVGAINIVRAGHAQLACEVNGEVSRQWQEPSEAGPSATAGIPFLQEGEDVNFTEHPRRWSCPTGCGVIMPRWLADLDS